MGSNAHGRLGVGNQSLTHSPIPSLVESLIDEKIVAVSCGPTHNVAISEIGEVYSWGLGDSGSLGLGNTLTKYTPTRINFFGANKLAIESASCGAKHTIFVTSMFWYNY